MTAASAAGRRRFRAPQSNGGTLISPPAEQFSDVLDAATDALAGGEFQIAGTDSNRVRRLARQTFLSAAKAYTSDYRVADVDIDAPRILLAGHQPELFHTGVWFKNFVLDELARREGAVAVNLLIDSDVVKNSSLRVPSGSVSAPRAEYVALDRAGEGQPYEERRVLDESLFRSFGERAATVIEPFVSEPLLKTFWPQVVERAEATRKLGAAVAQARHVLEGTWGLETLEIPQSHVCRGEAFCLFAAHLLCEHSRLRDMYNSALDEHRRVNHVRSAAHPVPDLGVDEGLIETPFWVWTAEQPLRRPLYAGRRGGDLMLTDRGDVTCVVSGEGSRAAEALATWMEEGVKLRTRALATTMYARLFLGDVFLHGIGGSKYDEVTDAIVRHFFGVEPPPYLTVSATLELPIDRPTVAAGELPQINRELREMEYHPEAFLDDSIVSKTPELAQLVEKKREWVATEQTSENARDRYIGIRDANSAMQRWLVEARREMEARRDELGQALRRESLFAWREYAFCLFPERSLRDFLLAFRARTP